MSNNKITELNELDDSLDVDIIPIVDIANGETKKQTKVNFLKEVNSLVNTNFSTGVVDGGELSAGTLNTQFSISDGFGYVVDATTDPDNPTLIKQSWLGKTDITVTTPSNLLNWIYLDAVGNVIQQATEPTPEQRRNFIVFGYVVSFDGATIDSFVNHSNVVVQVGNSVSDFMKAIGDMNISGNEYSNASNDLTIKRSAGKTFSINSNIFNNGKDPHFFDTSVLDPVPVFLYVYSDGAGGVNINIATEIDPDSYDDGSGTLATIPSANKWTIQRIAFSPITGLTVIQYGQTIYNSKESAEASIDSEGFDILPNVSPAGFRTSLVVKRDETDLSSSDTVFRHTGKFGYGIGNTSTGFGGQSLQDTYEISDEPEIITDVIRGALSLKRGSALDTDDVLEILNGAGDKKFSVGGDGEIKTSNNVPTNAVQDKAITLAKMADMTQYQHLGRNTGTGAPIYIGKGDVSSFVPTSGAKFLFWLATGQFAEGDIGDLPTPRELHMKSFDEGSAVSVGIDTFGQVVAQDSKVSEITYRVQDSPSGRGALITLRLVKVSLGGVQTDIPNTDGVILAGSRSVTVPSIAESVSKGERVKVRRVSFVGIAPNGLETVVNY